MAEMCLKKDIPSIMIGNMEIWEPTMYIMNMFIGSPLIGPRAISQLLLSTNLLCASVSCCLVTLGVFLYLSTIQPGGFATSWGFWSLFGLTSKLQGLSLATKLTIIILKCYRIE